MDCPLRFNIFIKYCRDTLLMSKIQFFTRPTTTRFGGVSKQLPRVFIGVTENGILRKVVILLDTVGYQ